MPEINYFWDEIEDNVVREYDESNNTAASYATEPTLYGSVLSQDRGGEVCHCQFDGQGNTTELTNKVGIVANVRRYSAFGTVTQCIGSTSISFDYAGSYGYLRITNAQTMYVRTRMLNTEQGRWLATDPAAELATFVYCDNRPLYITDPSGLRPLPMPIPNRSREFDEWITRMLDYFRDLQEFRAVVFAAMNNPCYYLGVSEVVFHSNAIIILLGQNCPSPLGRLSNAIRRRIEGMLESIQVSRDPCPNRCPCTESGRFGVRLSFTVPIAMRLWWRHVFRRQDIIGTLITTEPKQGYKGPCDVAGLFPANAFIGAWWGTCQPGAPPVPPPPPPPRPKLARDVR